MKIDFTVEIGWGTQFFGGPQSNVLMEVGVPIWTHKQCQATYSHKIFENAFCAGAFEGEFSS